MNDNRIAKLNQLALDAGAAILEIYARPFVATDKADGSPVTEADAIAEKIILRGLAELFPEIPVIAEESVEAGYLPTVGDTYFLVDPLDGTREFLKQNGEFTVNIALVIKGVPVFGVVSAPAKDEIFWGGSLDLDGPSRGQAFSATIKGGGLVDVQPLSVRMPPANGLAILASRSHLSPETNALIDQLNVAQRISIGSSLKLCWLAAGRADIYPRLAPTMQWDIAAGDAIVRAAGGVVVRADNHADFTYVVPKNATKDDLRNSNFLAVSNTALLADLAPVP
ncbi:MAG: 3'(2'),5'-bisphosphate nucleotidase CysQ [Roseibium sp.]